MGPLMSSTLKAQHVKSAAECEASCTKDYHCDVATFYDDERECALRMLPAASPHNMLRRGAHSWLKCMPKGVSSGRRLRSNRKQNLNPRVLRSRIRLGIGFPLTVALCTVSTPNIGPLQTVDQDLRPQQLTLPDPTIIFK